MGWDVNVHVNLQKQLMLPTRGVGWGGWLAEAVDDDDDDDNDDDDPNETCQFRDEISSRN